MKLDRVCWTIMEIVDSLLGNSPFYRRLRGGNWRFIPKGKVKV